MTFMFSIGAWGGFYCHSGRLCLGWVALTYLPLDIDDVLALLPEKRP